MTAETVEKVLEVIGAVGDERAQHTYSIVQVSVPSEFYIQELQYRRYYVVPIRKHHPRKQTFQTHLKSGLFSIIVPEDNIFITNCFPFDQVYVICRRFGPAAVTSFTVTHLDIVVLSAHRQLDNGVNTVITLHSVKGPRSGLGATVQTNNYRPMAFTSPF